MILSREIKLVREVKCYAVLVNVGVHVFELIYSIIIESSSLRQRHNYILHNKIAKFILNKQIDKLINKHF